MNITDHGKLHLKHCLSVCMSRFDLKNGSTDFMKFSIRDASFIAQLMFIRIFNAL